MATAIAGSFSAIKPDAVESKDGTAVGYRRHRHGPGLVVPHGAMESSRSHLKLTEALAEAMLAAADKKAAPGDVTVRALAPTLHYDFQLVLASQNTREGFGDIQADVLLLGGSKSPSFLGASLDALERGLPRPERVELAGLGHAASGNADDPMTGKGADPERVARELRRFFA